MEPRISLITLGVTDLERSYRFYKDGLGLPTTRTPDSDMPAPAERWLRYGAGIPSASGWARR
jgi:catechol 2,3-dioxygenase-like lactoylglutathione lyase family enzyme